MLTQIITNLIGISLVPLVGLFFLPLKKQSLLNDLLVSLATGTLLGGAFLHLLPESLEVLDTQTSLKICLISLLTFFFIEELFKWHHCQHSRKEASSIDTKASFAIINLLGDLMHNFIDGLVVAGVFLTNPVIGLPTVIAIVLHEIPQELGDAAILIKAGYKLKKVIKLNLLVALGAIAGGVIGYLLGQQGSSSQILTVYLLPVAAGNFIYLATADLIPQLKHLGCHRARFRVLNYAFIITGVILISFL